MKISSVLLIFFTSLMLRETAAYLPYFPIYKDDHTPLFVAAGFLAGFLAILLSLRKRRIITVATSTTSTTTTPPLRCNIGYTLYSGPGRSFCFLYSSNCASFANAQTACRLEGAGLLVLDDASLLPFLAVMRQQVPTTLSCTTPNVVWLNAKTSSTLEAAYPDGQSIPFPNELWAPGEPSTPNDCVTVEFSMNSSTLLDNPCGRPEKYVCQQF